MQVEVLTPDKTLYTGEAEVITLPGVNGSFQIMDNHAAMIANLKAGQMEVKNGGNVETFDVTGGLVEVIKNKVVVLV
jgi:F-type H+-transporting ATPase subunit epsilon